MAPLRRTFSRLNVLFICYGTVVEHRSLLNWSGICDRINCCNNCFVHTVVLSIKTAFKLVKIHLLFRIMPLIQWSVMFCRPCFKRFWGLKIYTPSVFRIYKYKCIINMRLLFLVYWLGWFSWLCLLHTTQVLLFLSLLSPPVKKNIMHIIHGLHHGQLGGCCGRDCMVVWFTITYAISAYHH